MLQPDLMDIQPQGAPAAAPAERKPRVLAVDDQRDALRLLQIRLENAGVHRTRIPRRPELHARSRPGDREEGR